MSSLTFGEDVDPIFIEPEPSLHSVSACYDFSQGILTKLVILTSTYSCPMVIENLAYLALHHYIHVGLAVKTYHKHEDCN